MGGTLAGTKKMDVWEAILYSLLGVILGRLYERFTSKPAPKPVQGTSPSDFIQDKEKFEERVRACHTKGEPCVLDVRWCWFCLSSHFAVTRTYSTTDKAKLS